VELQHTFTVPIGIDDAWTAFNDIEGIAPCLPGATITSVDGDEFTGAAKVKLGPISLQYTGKGRWTSRDAAEYRAVIEASGKDKRGNGTAAATITAHLEPEGSGTRVVVDTDLKITGRPAQFGRGVIQEVGNKLLDQFATCLSEQLGQPESAVAGPVAEEKVPTLFGEPSGGEGPPEAAAVGTAGAAATEPAREDPTPPDVRADELARASAAGQAVASPAASSGPAASAVSSAEAAAEDPAVPDVPVGDAAGEPGGPSVVLEAADVPDVPTSPAGSAPSATSAPAPSQQAAPPRPAPAEAPALDLGGLVGPVLLRQYGPTAAAVVVTAILTWVVARRRYR
jgi:carbon monoxide dehydrogenase subunit G